MQTTREAIDDLKRLGVKTLGNQLDNLASSIVELLSQAAREAQLLHDQEIKEAGLDWATVCQENIRTYQNKLVRAMAERDPRGMWYAAAKFSALPRYVGDLDYSWFSRKREFDEVLTTLLNTAAAIVGSINEFDADNIAQARKALM